ncbi:MAG: chorismate mutase [Candidatus Onthovivens sp.]|nr:chorismate mutase [Candidatus Onthovivens sp.]
MDKIEEYRKEIDEIDSEIIELFERRMDVVKQVIDFKIRNNFPVTDSSREELMLQKNLNKIKNSEYKAYYFEVLNGFLKASKQMQNDFLSNKKD